jgi:hypothetical protein
MVGVGADPEPYEPIISLDGKRAVTQPDSNGPETADLLEV